MSIRTIKAGDLEYLTAEGITAVHCFTTRLGGVSQGDLFSLNIAHHRGDSPENVAQNYRILADALGFDPDRLVLTRQTHSDIVRVVTGTDCAGLDHHGYPECDALVTKEPGVGLVVFTADCTPILFHDPVTGAVGAAHAGWRGTAADIAGKTVKKMVEAFGCNPADIRAAVGPNIGACCFETDADVPQAMRALLGDRAEGFIRPAGNKYYVNLKGINAQLLVRAGLRHIDMSSHCTACDQFRFWSHRKVGARRGSQGAIIICREGTL